MENKLSPGAQAIEDGQTLRKILAATPPQPPREITVEQAVEALLRHAANKPSPYVPISQEINGVLVGGVLVCVGEEHFDRLLSIWPRKQ